MTTESAYGKIRMGVHFVAVDLGRLNPTLQIDRLRPVSEAEPTTQMTQEYIGGSTTAMKLDEAIRAALEYEAGVHRTYREALDRTNDEAGKRIFQTLCDEEMSHLSYLRERLEEWGTSGKIKVEKLETSIPTRAAIDESLQHLRTRLSPQASEKHTLELELLRKALDVESRTSDFYRELVGKLEGDGRTLFERFVEIEEGHQAIVQAEISSLSGFGVWFDTADFRPDGS